MRVRNMWFKLRQHTFFRDGKGSGTYTYIDHPGSVLVVPVTTDLQVMLIRSYRFTLDSWCWEVPAGTLAGHSDVSPEAAAIRELREEAGGRVYFDSQPWKILQGQWLLISHAERFFRITRRT